ncbi:MAG TPA: D-arabinono-1,4-lactone oxidase [Streptosporangiaceae bacterium]|jgi:hypothetical protein|nr:D-arabinono-1,4-lactone oxidase [Streptosporangiaceae bacterium]
MPGAPLLLRAATHAHHRTSLRLTLSYSAWNLRPPPHRGKLFSVPPERIASEYQRLPDFAELLRSYDPSAKFRNPFLDTYLPA